MRDARGTGPPTRQRPPARAGQDEHGPSGHRVPARPPRTDGVLGSSRPSRSRLAVPGTERRLKSSSTQARCSPRSSASTSPGRSAGSAHHSCASTVRPAHHAARERVQLVRGPATNHDAGTARAVRVNAALAPPRRSEKAAEAAAARLGDPNLAGLTSGHRMKGSTARGSASAEIGPMTVAIRGDSDQVRPAATRGRPGARPKLLANSRMPRYAATRSSAHHSRWTTHGARPTA